VNKHKTFEGWLKDLNDPEQGLARTSVACFLRKVVDTRADEKEKTFLNPGL